LTERPTRATLVIVDAGLVGAVIAAAASLVVALWSARISREVQGREREAAEDLERFKTRATKEVEFLKAELQERADQAKWEHEEEAVLSRYRKPLTAAAFDLQSRLYNIIEKDFLETYADQGNERADEAIKSTLYRFAQYFCWREILRQDVHFLRFSDDAETRAVGDLLIEVEKEFNTDDYNSEFMLWRDEQRAIGELMIVKEGSTKACLEYWHFFDLYDTKPSIARWFVRLDRHLRSGAARNDFRLSVVQSALRKLVMQIGSARTAVPPLGHGGRQGQGAAVRISLIAASGSGARHAGA
jgi:hypothetical protein